MAGRSTPPPEALTVSGRHRVTLIRPTASSRLLGQRREGSGPPGYY